MPMAVRPRVHLNKRTIFSIRVCSLQIDTSEYMFKLALAQRRYDAVLQVGGAWLWTVGLQSLVHFPTAASTCVAG